MSEVEHHISIEHACAHASDSWAMRSEGLAVPELVYDGDILHNTTGYVLRNPSDNDVVQVPHMFKEWLCHHVSWINVLDSGFVRIVDQMGDESSIVQAARVSYGDGTKSVREDKKLIRYLYEHRHTTPFEMVEFKFHVLVPMDCWRQWIRHRTASVNEYSTRYSVAIDAMSRAGRTWRKQGSVANKQGSGDLITDTDDIDQLQASEAQLHLLSRQVYAERLRLGVAREQARKDLPLSTYTTAYWKMDLHNLLHFLRLRCDPHAQQEIRSYAWAIVSLLEARVPTVMEMFKEGLDK